MAQALNNRLHRSGAIDYNVEFDVRQAQIQKSKSGASGKKIWDFNDVDELSVCEGEPLFSIKQPAGKKQSNMTASRRPISLLSSLNGYVAFEETDYATMNTDLNNVKAGGSSDDAKKICADIRSMFFKNLRVSGFSVSKWAFARAGHQGDQFVATSGGLNTIYVDDDVEAGDILVADIPSFENSPPATSTNPFGFVEWQQKKGVPKSKKTLVVRAMPRIGHASEPKEKDNDMLDEFHLRGQVIGRCVRGAKKGERADIVHCHNAIGMKRKYRK